MRTGAEAPATSPIPRRLLDEADSLTGALHTLVERFPDFRCLTNLDRHGHERILTLAELWARAEIVRASLTRSGLAPGGIVILILPTGPELVASYFGVLLAGGIPGLL